MFGSLGTVIPVVIVVIVVLLFLINGFVSASPAEIKVVSGPWGQRIIHGKTGFKVPLIERVDSMTAAMIPVDVKTSDYVPTNDFINVQADAAVKVRIATETPELLQAATRNFLYKNIDEISDEVRDTLEGHLRAIIGQMKLKDIVTDRDTFAQRVQDNAHQDLAEMGLEIVAFNIQGFADKDGTIDNLGVANVATIRKDAEIAQARSNQEISEAQAAADKASNEARVNADLDIAQKQTDLAMRKAALKVEADTENAKADAAYEIQKQIQQKDIERETAAANIVKQEQEAVVKQKEVEVTKNTLDSQVRAKADAERYAAEQAAQADLFRRQKEAEAQAYERTQAANATREAMLAEAEGIRAKGDAEAAATAAKLTAEAEGLEKKAEAMAKMNQAAVLEMYFNALPDVARAVAEPLANVDSITMYGEGNAAKLTEDITKSMTQINAGLGDSMGLDLKQLFGALVGAKAIAPTLSDAVAKGVKAGTEKTEKNPSSEQGASGKDHNEKNSGTSEK